MHPWQLIHFETDEQCPSPQTCDVAQILHIGAVWSSLVRGLSQ